MEHQVELLTEAIRLAQRKCFGASSERSGEDTMERLSLLFNKAEVYADQWSAEHFLKPVYDQLHEDLLKREVLHADEATLGHTAGAP